MTAASTALLRLLPAAIFVALFGAVGAQDKVQRYGAVIGVEPDKLDHYKKLHANPWPSVNKALKDANIRNYSIYLTQFDDGKWRLFSYFEYTGDNFEADMKKLAGNDDVQRWWKETKPCQIPFRTRKADEWWKSMEEVYHLD